MSREREQRLVQLPGWTWNTKDAQWEESFGALSAYVAEHGTARPPYDYVDEHGVNLRAWVDKQRVARRQGGMSKRREARLTALPGWVWNARRE
jgi:hypothetical protein